MDAYNSRNLLLSWLFPSLGGFLYGYDIGAMAEVLRLLSSSWDVELSPVVQGLMTSMVTVGATFGSLFVFAYESFLGRRGELLLASLFFAVGAFGETTARGPWSMCAARSAYGGGVGFAMHGAPSYIAETAPASLRGALVSAKEAMIVLGMLSGYALGATASTEDWRFVFASAVPLALVMSLGVFSLPPSPRWLALKGRRDDAKRAFRFVSPSATDDSPALAELLSTTVGEEQDGDSALLIDKNAPMIIRRCFPHSALLADPANRVALTAGVGLVVLQQVTGQPSVLYYAAQVLEDAGLGASSAVALAAWKLACTSLAVTSVDSFGRKTLLYAGSISMAVALATLVVLSTFYQDDPSRTKYFTLVSMFVFIGGYQVGFGPVTWTYISECFPLARRGKAIAIATVTNFSLNAIVTFGAAPLLALSSPACFGTFFVLTLYSIYFVYAHVPETQGLTLEQITDMLQRRAGFRHLRGDLHYGTPAL